MMQHLMPKHMCGCVFVAVWPGWEIYCSLDKPVATIILPKSPIFLGNFCKGVEKFQIINEIIFGQLL